MKFADCFFFVSWHSFDHFFPVFCGVNSSFKQGLERYNHGGRLQWPLCFPFNKSPNWEKEQVEELHEITHRVFVDVDIDKQRVEQKERQRPKSSYDPSDVVGTSSEEGYNGGSKKSHLFGRYSSGSIDRDGGRKWGSAQESTQNSNFIGQAVFDDTQEHLYHGLEACSNTRPNSISKDVKYGANTLGENLGSWNSRLDDMDSSVNVEVLSTPRINMNGLVYSDHRRVSAGFSLDNEVPPQVELSLSKLSSLNSSCVPYSGLSIPQILHLICNGNDECSSASKRGALQQLVEASMANEQSIWSKAFNEIQTLISKTNGKVVGDLVTPVSVAVREGTNLEDAARLLLETRYRRLPILDGDGKLVGIITRGNIVRAALQIKLATERMSGFRD